MITKSVFISYSSSDETYAAVLERVLSANHIPTWFAPKDITAGENFADMIGKELSVHTSEDPMERIDEDCEHLGAACFFILLLSANSMKSKWVKKELMMAISANLPIRVLRIDHSALNESFGYLLQDIQITDTYHMNKHSLTELMHTVNSAFGMADDTGSRNGRREMLAYEDIGIYPIASGDPYFEENKTLFIHLGKGQFFLAPPWDMRSDPDSQAYLAKHTFAEQDDVFGISLEEYCKSVPIDHLYEMIEESRRKIFSQFVHKENGSYYNNQKYGISDISGFERTENMREQPVLRVEMFLTDYFTHRVMKDVCKRLTSADPSFIKKINFNKIGSSKILLTSLGVNLILSQGNEAVLLTGRSTNAAETYQRHSFSVSMIEGVSISDYDTYNDSISARFAVERGLQEELGVETSMLKIDTLHFYDLFINASNLEIGLSCSIELKQDLTMDQDILKLHGKDEGLEISEKRVIPAKELETFLDNNYAAILPQAVFSICTYLEAFGIYKLDRMLHSLVKDTASVISKDGSSTLCGDTYVWGDHFIAVIDGATPKGDLLWNGQKGDVFVSHLIADAVVEMDPYYTAQEAIRYINDVVCRTYEEFHLDFNALHPEERLQASLLIYSRERREIWSFGDCMLRINSRNYTSQKEGDKLFAALRAFCIQVERDRLGTDADEQYLSSYGREQILPYLKEYTNFANRNIPFGYDVIDGGTIHEDHVKIYAVKKDDCVVMASDGYPELFNTLEETEDYLQKALAEDPICAGPLRGTKGIEKGNASYDDRTYVSFRVY